MNPRYLYLAACFVAASPGAEAAIFAREDFNYVDGALAGSNGGLGWQAAWTNAQGTPVVAGSKGVVNSVSNQQGARLISQLQEPPVGGTKTVWVSFEGQQTTNVTGTTSTNSFGGLGLYRGNTEQLLIGKSWPGDYQWKAGTGGGLVGPAVPVSTLSMTKIVARITMVDAATDTLDVWINPADTSSVAALGAPHITRTDADLSFDTLRIRSGEGDAAVTAEGWLFDAVTAGDNLADVVAADSDGDGMLDAWETAHGLIVGINDSKGDPDHDNSPNDQEYQRSTDPNLWDTDGDGLSDGVETGTGIFIGATNTGTSPTQLDSDGDSYDDSQEDGSGIFTDESDPGTNPNLADSDGDTHRDDFEAAHGSNPNSAASVPATGDLTLIGSDNFDSYPDGAIAGQAGGNGFDYDNSTANNSFVGHSGPGSSDWNNVTGFSDVVGGKLRTLNSGAKREFNGPGEGATADGDEYVGAVNQEAATSGHVVYLRADLRRGADTTWSGISAYDFGSERAFAGVPDAANPASGNREFAIGAPSPDPVYSGITAVAGRDYTLVVKLDYQSGMISLWVDPDLTAGEPAPAVTAPFTVAKWTTAARLGSGGTNDLTEWDHFVVAREWSALSVFPGVTPPDDNFQAWISGYAVNGQSGFDQDPDHDGLSNGVEHVLGSSPVSFGTSLRDVARVTPNSFRFRHTRTNALASDVTSSYEWSANLTDWHASGQTDSNGVTATIAGSVITDTSAPALDEVEVTVTVTGGSAARVFCRLRADLK